MFEQGDFFPFLVLFAGIALVPYLLLVASSFVKVAVVLMILRNALGIQQTPPNILIYAIALSLTIFIMQPIAVDSIGRVTELDLDYERFSDFLTAGSTAIVPIRAFLEANTDAADLAVFSDMQANIWQDRAPPDDAVTELTVLTPAFMLSELTRAFKMGFLIYLPFLAVDLVVTTILMALGMMMVSPTIVAVPFKLLLFVSLEGWAKLLNGLVLTYS